VSDEAKPVTPSWPSVLTVILCITTAGSVIATCEAKDSERRAWQVRDRYIESRDAQLRELQLRHESARECCRQPGVGYAECIGAFGIGASK
jgi:hypothetical protein